MSSRDDSFTFTHSTHVRLNKKKPEQVYAMKTLERGLLHDMLQNCRMKLIHNDPEEHLVKFELSNCDVSLANALRRIMIADVPCCAIDDVYILKNSGVMQDEMLVHRLGLLPILHPGIADFKQYIKTDPNAQKTSENTLVFRLKVDAEMDDLKIGHNDCFFKNVMSSDLKWVPQGDLQKSWGPDEQPRCTLDDIVITRLGLHQGIEVEAHCILGVGSDHAKWSPVSTATYRMFPEIRFKKKGGVTGNLARELVKLHGDIFDLDENVPKEEGRWSCSCGSAMYVNL